MAENEEIVQVKKAELEMLIQQKNEQDKEIAILKNSIIKLMEILGIAENGVMNKKILTGEEPFMGPLLGSLGHITRLMVQSEMPIVGKRAAKEIEEKFHFIKELLPVIEKYSKAS